MSERQSEKSIESDLLDELLVGKRYLQKFALEVLSGYTSTILVDLSKFLDADITPSSDILKQLAASIDAVEEKLAESGGLIINKEPISDFQKRFRAIDSRRQEVVRRTFLSILQELGIDRHARLTLAQRRKLKAVLDKDLEGYEVNLGPGRDLGPDKAFVIELLSDLLLPS